jgi:phosphate uptake regulator
MTTLAGSQLHSATTACAARDIAQAQQVERDDDAIDKLNRGIFEVPLELEDASDERELGLRYVLIARSLERVRDNAVDIAEQAAFLVTHQLREFTDASRPKLRRSDATRWNSAIGPLAVPTRSVTRRGLVIRELPLWTPSAHGFSHPG